jgi:HAD superfamily hydrolase (TIGR01490 family)
MLNYIAANEMIMKKIILFDVDNVIVKGQTQKILINFLLKKRRISILFFLNLYIWFILYKIGLIKDTFRIRNKAFKAFKNCEKDDIDNLFKEFFEKEIKQRIVSQSHDLVRDYLNKNYEVILVSASLSEIVNNLKRYLALNYSVSTELEILNGHYTGRVSGDIPYGTNKINMVKKLLNTYGFSLVDSYAYTDHISDMPLLELVTHPGVINPDRKLRKMAKLKNWSIYDFK